MTKVEYFERKEVNTKRATAKVIDQKVFFKIGSEKIRAMVEIIELVMTPIPVHAGLLRTCIVSCSMVSIGAIGYSLQNDLVLGIRLKTAVGCSDYNGPRKLDRWIR